MPNSTYYTLLVRESARSYWEPEFGDYDRECVEDEKRGNRDHGIKAGNLKIIITADDQDSITTKINQLNRGV